jgi:ribosomal protein S19
MIRSKWKPAYIYFRFSEFCDSFSDFEGVSPGMKKRNLVVYLRNKCSTIDLDEQVLRKINDYKINIYNGMQYVMLTLDKYAIGSKIGEFLVTKMRGNSIHGALTDAQLKGSKKTKKKILSKI